MREIITVYGIEKDGSRFRVAGYNRETALQVVHDITVKNIVNAEKLVAIDKNGKIIAEG